jgi:hypothetical protein
MISSIPELKNLKIVPRMLRPSILLQAAPENDGRIQLGLAIGQHGRSAGQPYQDKWPTRLLYDRHAEKYQKALETLIVANLDEAATRLGITKEEFDRRLGSLQDTGLGVFCRNVLGRPGNEGRPCTELDCWNCPQMLIVAEVETIAALQLWQESLRAVEAVWERDHLERWEAKWLPWLVLTDVVEEKMKRGLIKIWNAARALADRIKISPNFVPFRPF